MYQLRDVILLYFVVLLLQTQKICKKSIYNKNVKCLVVEFVYSDNYTHTHIYYIYIYILYIYYNVFMYILESFKHVRHFSGLLGYFV